MTTSTDQARLLVEELFQDLPLADLTDQAVEGFLLLADDSKADRWQIMGPEVGGQVGLRLADALAMLVTAVNLAALRVEPERLHLHAGAAVRDGRAIVMSAPRETGKSTTLARLVLRGWDFISDEAVSVNLDDEELHGFPKPLSIKPQGRGWVPELLSHTVPPIAEVADHEIVHVPLGTVGAVAVPAAEPQIVVLLQRTESQSDAGVASLPVHPVDAVVQLMAETMDAARFGGRAVEVLARLAARCACHEVLIGAPDATAAHLEDLFQAPPSPPLPVRTFHGGVHIKDEVTSIVIGDRVVIHQPPDGAVLALDAAGTQVWLALGGWEPNEDIDLRGPVVAPFVDQLVAVGIVEPWWSDP